MTRLAHHSRRGAPRHPTTDLQIPPPLGGRVVGADDSPAGRAALAVAADLAASLGSPLVAVHARTRPGPAAHGMAQPGTEDESVLAGRAAAAVLDAAVATVEQDRPGSPIQRVVDDMPLRALVSQARGARLLAVDHRSHTSGTRSGLGSTSRALVELVPCPVVVTGLGTGTDPASDTARGAGARSTWARS